MVREFGGRSKTRKNGVRTVDISTSILDMVEINPKLKFRNLSSKKNTTRIFVPSRFTEAILVIK